MGSDLDIYFHGSESGFVTPKQVVVLTVAGVSIATVGGRVADSVLITIT